jgi:hypothetical protein
MENDIEIMKKVYLDRYDKDIVDSFGRIYLTDDLYLCPDGTIEED